MESLTPCHILASTCTEHSPSRALLSSSASPFPSPTMHCVASTLARCTEQQQPAHQPAATPYCSNSGAAAPHCSGLRRFHVLNSSLVCSPRRADPLLWVRHTRRVFRRCACALVLGFKILISLHVAEGCTTPAVWCRRAACKCSCAYCRAVPLAHDCIPYRITLLYSYL